MWRRIDFSERCCCYPQCINNKEVLNRTKIRLLEHPVCSSDLNPIENIFMIDCCISLWRRSTVLNDFRTQKRSLRCMGKRPSVQLQKVVDSMPSRIFEVIKANGRSTKYWIKNLHLYSIVLLILKLSINTYIHIKNELKFLHILNLIVFMSYLSYIWFS